MLMITPSQKFKSNPPREDKVQSEDKIFNFKLKIYFSKFERNEDSKIGCRWWNPKIIFAFFLYLVLLDMRGLTFTIYMACDKTCTEF